MKRKLIAALILCSVTTTSMLGIESVKAFAEEASTQKTENLDAASKSTANKEDSPIINGLKINKQLISINYSVGVTIVPRYIVIHDTDNRAKGANAMANRNYFANHPEALASAHYTVDQDNIIQCLENTWRGWHCGDKFNPTVNNSNTIAIELCVNSDNDFDKTVENGIELTKYLMKKYNIPASNVIRHHDVSGKICPKMMMVDRPELWPYFKKRVAEADISNTGNGSSGSNQPSTSPTTPATPTNNGQTSGNGGSNSGSGNPSSTPIGKKGKVINVSSMLNVRSGPSTSNNIITYLKNGDEVQVVSEINGWYNISFGSGKTGYVSKTYISLVASTTVPNNNTGGNTGTTKPNNGTTTGTGTGTGTGTTTKPIDLGNQTTVTSKGKVTGVSTNLNLRKGPGASYGVIAYLLNNTEVTIKGQQGDWYLISANGKEGYVSKTYIQILSSSGSSTNTAITVGTSGTSVKNGVIKNVSTNLNVRKGAGTSYAVVGYLLNGTKVTVKSVNNGWANILFDTTLGIREGYISTNYLQIIGQL